MKKLRVLDLFSGIGGFSLGLDRAGGFETVAFCEIKPYCRRVLAKHWPGVPIYEDVRKLTADTLSRDGIAVDVICGGFPCQDISLSGTGDGITGDRSRLWFEYARLVGELRPKFALVENVAELLGRGAGDVLGSLAALGYDAEWHCIPASAVGAPHRRDRIWIIANSGSIGLAQRSGILTRRQISDAAAKTLGQWYDLSEVGRALHGLPNRVDRLKALGNAVVPQIPELIGRAILQAEGMTA